MSTELPLRAEAVLFDLDGTLIDSTAAVVRCWLKWAGEYDIDPRRLRDAPGRPSADIVTGLLPADRVAEANARIDALEIADTVGVMPLPGVLDLLSSVPRDRWAIATSCTAPLATARMAAAALPVPAVLVTADQVARGKPDPQCWLLAAERLGIDPVHCVVVEDAPAGITAARAAGMRVVAVTTTHSVADLADADVVVSGPGQLRMRPVGAGVLGLRAVRLAR